MELGQNLAMTGVVFFVLFVLAAAFTKDVDTPDWFDVVFLCVGGFGVGLVVGGLLCMILL